jgi:hypothetical protein
MDRRGAVPGVLFGAVMVNAAAGLIARGGDSATIVGVVGLALFGPGVIVLLGTIVHPPVLLTIDASGIQMGSIVPAMRRFVPWEAILGVRIYRLRVLPFFPGSRALGFVPRDSRSAVWRRRLKGQQRRYGVVGSLVGMRIGMELEELVGLMQGFHPELRFGYGGTYRRPSTTHHRLDDHGAPPPRTTP